MDDDIGRGEPPVLPVPDPITPLVEMAVQLKELYDAYIEAGFTADQAMELLLHVLGKGMDQ